MAVNQHQQTSRRTAADAAQVHSACRSRGHAVSHDATACSEQSGHLLCQCGQYGWLETLLQHLAVHYGDGHRQMPYIRFVSCSGYYHFIYSQVPGNARAVLCSLRKSRHCPKAGYRKE